MVAAPLYCTRHQFPSLSPQVASVRSSGMSHPLVDCTLKDIPDNTLDSRNPHQSCTERAAPLKQAVEL
jgi:hypothetical protein